MSFQDVGKRNSHRPAVNAAMGSSSSRIPMAATASQNKSSVFASMSVPASTVTTQISDSLTQYHRNVGILEKIAHALLNSNNSGGRNNHRTELEQQYKAQSEVLRELESRLKEQILGQRQRVINQAQTSTNKQALSKLERDFERVQATVTSTKAKVTKQMKQYQQRDGARADAAATSAQNTNTNTNSSQYILQQQQLQVQHDRLQEEIMNEREDEIRKINKGMHQVNEIYKDLAHIVGAQQEHVDQIENKMEETKVSAQSGLEQVVKANDKYGGGPTDKCIIM